MERKLYPVEIQLGETSRTYSPEFQTSAEYADDWKRVLVMSHNKAKVTCMCPGNGDKRLSIHYRSNSDNLHLAKFPDTGMEHSEDCTFFSEDPAMSGLGGYKRGVVQELDDGNVKIKLKVGLQQRPTKAPDETAAEPAAASKPKAAARKSSQSSMTLLGLLHYLWTQADLNVWMPGMEGKRSLGVVHHHLLKVASMTYAGKHRLASNLLIATPQTGRQAEINKAKAMEAINRRQRLVVIAPLSQYQPEMETSASLPISGFHGIPFLNMTSEQWEVAQKRFAHELNCWMTGEQVMAIVQTDPPKPAGGTPRAQVVDVAFMHLTKKWIPVDSGYEAAVAAELVNQNRRFSKPLRFDSGTEQVFPDFWLLDCGEHRPMEVWGLTDPDYQARKAKKVEHYDLKYGEDGWWQWDAAAGGDIPAFPDRTGSRRDDQNE